MILLTIKSIKVDDINFVILVAYKFDGNWYQSASFVLISVRELYKTLNFILFCLLKI